MAQDPGWVVVTSPDGRDMTIGSEPGELAVTIESEVALNGAVTVEETDERSFGDYVCWLLAGEISDLDGASSWDEFAAPIWNDLSADPELAELFDRDPSVFAEHVEASAYEVCSGLAESFADGSGRELVQQGYDSAVIED